MDTGVVEGGIDLGGEVEEGIDMGPVIGDDVNPRGIGVECAGDRVGWSGSPSLRPKEGDGVAATPGSLLDSHISYDRCRACSLYFVVPPLYVSDGRAPER